MARRPIDVPTLAKGVLDGSRATIARAITLVESTRPDHREAAQQLLMELLEHAGGAHRVGISGVPGVGKSTFIDELGTRLTAAGHRVAVLAVDPSSTRTRGSILGDKTRMARLAVDDNAFIRPSPTAGTLGGVARATRETILVMEAAGYDVVIVETVGVGQAEVDVMDHADTIVLVLMPGSGDSIQALKAGVMEIPDVIVVNKADHPLTDTMVREIRGVLSLGEQKGWRVPIVKTQAAHDVGIDELLERLEAHRSYIQREGTLLERRRRNLMNEVVAIASSRMRRELEASIREDPDVQRLLDEVCSRRLDPASAATRILARGLARAAE
jgi:GTPase